MMLSNVERGKKMGEDLGNGKLSKEMETISKTALYVDKNFSRSSMYALGNRPKSAGRTRWMDAKSKIKHGGADPSHKDKKSIWNWKPFKGLSHSRNRKFNCCFSLQVHSIEGLPSTLDNRSVCVHLKRRDGELVTRPVKVLDGVAEFDEMLTHTCMVSGTRSGSHHCAKYEPKHFLLYASIFDAPKRDLGKHRVDVTRLLPITLEELEEDKSSGAWSTNYKLSGQAKGATLNVSFGYAVVGDSPEISSLNMSKLGQGDAKGETNYSGSFPDTPNLQSNVSSRSVDNMKDFQELLPTRSSELAIFVDVLRQKFDEDKMAAAVDYKPELDEFWEYLESHKSRSCSMSECSHKGVENEFMEHLEPIQSHSCSMSESSPKGTENEFIEHFEHITSGSCSMSESSQKGVENDFMEHLEPVKSHCCSISESNRKGTENEFMEQLEPTKSHCCTMSESGPKGLENEGENGWFSVTEQRMESPNQAGERPEDAAVEVEAVTGPDVAPENGTMPNSSPEAQVAPCDGDFKEEFICSKESILKDLDHALNDLSNLEIEALDSPDASEDFEVVKTDNEDKRVERSSSLDELTESVANEFLDMLGIGHSPFSSSPESEPESPRERLLRQFEKEVLSGGCSLFDFNLDYGDQIEVPYGASTASRLGDFSEDFELSSVIQATERKRQMETRSVCTKTGAKTLEDMEAEALMREWGLNDKDFHCSPLKSSCGFGSPIDLPLEKPLELPSLAEGLGPLLQTRNGGFLRSMNSSLFKNAKNGGNLIMQVSSPVVVPAEMGSDIMEILQQLASLGIEKLSIQANKLMPLEDITGKTMQQVAWEAAIALEASERQSSSQEVLEIEVKERSSGSRYDNPNSSSIGSEQGSEYVSLDDLAPLAMDKIEPLSVEGLRIQAGMSDEDAPSSIRARSVGVISALQGKGVGISGSFGLEATAGLKLLNIKDTVDDIDGLMGLSLTLDEWMRLDSGEVGDGDEISDRTSKILAAHHASSLDLIRGVSDGGQKRGKGSAIKCGLLGNNFTVAFMVQLRDPLRNYEPVGTPMLAFIQVERVCIPPKPKIYCKVSEVSSNSEEDDDESELILKEDVRDEGEKKALEEDKEVPHFRISEVHVAGLNLKTEPGKKQLWGNATQQQSGSRWLLANGMGKCNKHQVIKSKTTSTKSPAPLPTNAWTGEVLWSTSSRVHFTGDKWKEPTRNPNVIFPKGSIWLR